MTASQKRKRAGIDIDIKPLKKVSLAVSNKTRPRVNSTFTTAKTEAPAAVRVAATAAATEPEKAQQQEDEDEDEEDMSPQLSLIAASNRSPFEKKVWSLLCQIPRGRVSTYGLMSAHLGSSPRAVGNALRRNPFAPRVPCHRVVATGGALGGFKGKWPRDGEGITIDEKRTLLRKEGVRLDGAGRVLGTPWAGFC